MSNMKSKIGNAIWTTAKLAVTGATIAAIAIGFGIFDSNLEVQDSEADIVSFDFAEREPVQKFEDSLDDLGHPDPRPFNLNGNTVYFSSIETTEEPKQVMERYLREFYEEGLNSRPEYAPNAETGDAVILDGQAGGIVPMFVSNDQVILGGMELAKDWETADDLRAIFRDHDKDAPWKLWKGYRNIEISRTDRKTLVSASWSRNDFDYEKMMMGNESEDQNVSTEVPGCIGCVRVNSFEDLSASSNYRNDIYMGASPPEELSRFYDQALSSRGWEPTEATIAFDRVRQYADFKGEDAIMRRYARGLERMTVMSYRDQVDDASVVHTIRHD